MGIRSNNYIAIKPSIPLTYAVMKYLNKDTADIQIAEMGTLIVYESNFTPMYARKGPGCTFDLEMEVEIQKFLGSMPESFFHMKRAGDEIDHRGEWTDHPFGDNEAVIAIEQETADALAAA